MDVVYSLLAQADLGQAYSRYSRRPSALSDNWLWFAIVVAIAGLWIGLYYWDRCRKQRSQPRDVPNSLFHDLCHAHALTRAEQDLLARLMEARPQLPQAAVFVRPEFLAEQAAAAIPEAPEYRNLALKLFGR